MYIVYQYVYYQEPIKKGAGNFNAGCDEALSRFLWGVVEEMM